MWATITVKHKMRPTSERNPGPHHTGISGPHPMESPAHIDRNTQHGFKTHDDKGREVVSHFVMFNYPNS